MARFYSSRTMEWRWMGLNKEREAEKRIINKTQRSGIATLFQA